MSVCNCSGPELNEKYGVMDAKKVQFQLKSRLAGRKADYSTRNVGFSAEKETSGVVHDLQLAVTFVGESGPVVEFVKKYCAIS
jgi:hypothetical protein